MKTTAYFDHRVTAKRPEIKPAWCEAVVAHPIETRVQEDGRIQHWGSIESVERTLRVVTLADGETFHNAFFDRHYKEPS